MDFAFSFLFILFGPMLWLALLIALVYFLVKRLERERHEDFEKRDN